MQANYFDGKSSRRYRVNLLRHGSYLAIEGEGIARQIALNQVHLPSALGTAPRRLEFPDGAFCEVSHDADLVTLLGKQKGKLGLVARMEQSLAWAVCALVVTGACVFAAYRWGLPYAAEQIAYRVPHDLVAKWSAQSFAWADEHFFQPSQISLMRQKAIQTSLERLQIKNANFKYQLHFRNSPDIGPNAFAMPSGDIVVTDDLIKLATHDEEVVAVLAHEIGHVARRHALRSTIQSAGMAIVAMAIFGDFTSMTAQLSAITQLSYSRAMENEADRYAIELLNQNHKSARPLANMLNKLMHAQHPHSAKKDSKQEEAQEGFDFLATHPTTQQRIDNIIQHDRPLP